jgi:hypothetical protein
MAARPVKVNSVNPSEANQFDRVTVTINGSGFDTRPEAVEAINFLLPCDPDSEETCTETGGVEVEGWDVPSDKKINATVRILGTAIIDVRDVEVLIKGGRGGKGTTLFNVWSADTCDQDGDGWNRSNASCDADDYLGIDCDDKDPVVQSCEPPGGGSTFTQVNIRVGYFDADTGGSLEDASPWTGDPDYHEFGDGWINWDANTLTDDDLPRPCRALWMNDPNGASRYDCFEDASNGSDWPHGGRISLDISGGMGWVEAPPPRRGWKKPELCAQIDLMSDLIFGVTRYQIHITDGCTSDGIDVDCPISVKTASYSGSADPEDDDYFRLHDFPDIGRLVVHGIVDPESVVFPPAGSNELNVFTEAQELVIDKFRVSFESVKNGALLAICETSTPISGIQVWTFPESLP